MNIHVVQPGETLSSIAEIYGTSEFKLIQDNGLVNYNDLVTGQTIVIVYPEQTYIVQAGDTLIDIASSHNISTMQLLRNNPFLADRDYIYPGEELVIRYNTTGTTSTMGFSYPFVNKDILKKNLPYLTYLSIFNYQATDEGNIISHYDDSEIIQLSKEYHTAPLVMMTTLTEQGQVDLEVAYKLLLNEEFQDTQLDNLLNIIKEKGYLGANFVFYLMTPSNLDLYYKFIKKAYIRLKEKGLFILVTINPKLSTIDDEVPFQKIDYSKISSEVESVTFLQFIWGLNYGPPSPVININHYKKLVDYAVTLVPPENFMIGIPMIAYDWALSDKPLNLPALSLTTDSAIRLAQDVGATIQFDETSLTPYFEYVKSITIGASLSHIVWFIDPRSIDALLNIIKEHQLSGISIWNTMTYHPQLCLMINSQYEIRKVID